MTMRGMLVTFDSTNWLAEVRLDGSPWHSLSGVKVARNIASGEMTAGRRVLVDVEEGDEPVVVGVWV
jgi:hypothetical protein